jgi:hypothetical protein
VEVRTQELKKIKNWVFLYVKLAAQGPLLRGITPNLEDNQIIV